MKYKAVRLLQIPLSTIALQIANNQLWNSICSFCKSVHLRDGTTLNPSLQDSISTSLPGKPKIRRFRSIDPTAIYLASGPNFTLVALPKTRQNCQSKRKNRSKWKEYQTKSNTTTTKNWQVSRRKITCARHIRESFDSVPFWFDTSSLEDSAKVQEPKISVQKLHESKVLA